MWLAEYILHKTGVALVRPLRLPRALLILVCQLSEEAIPISEIYGLLVVFAAKSENVKICES